MTGSAPDLPLLHRLWRRLPARGRRQMLTALTGALAPRIDRVPPAAAAGVAVVGEFSRASGLGEGARLMSRSLGQLGIPHWDIDVGAVLPAHTADFAVASEAPPPDALLVLHVNPPLLPLALLGLPRGLVRGRRVVGYWSWELPAVPPEWRAGTRFVHEVWVPSEFTAGAMEPLLPGRVRVVPHPVAAVSPVPSALDRAAFGLPADAVVVLVAFNLASSFERKNPLAAIAAFRAAFGDRPDRILLLKIGNPAHFPADFARIGAAAAGAGNIRLETRLFPAADMHALTAAADIVLSLHRSEGFGLGLAEAMLLGKPVIATGWSGNTSFMDTTSAALIDYRLVAAHDPRGIYVGAAWAEPDAAASVAELRRLAEDPAARQAMGRRARAVASAQLSAAPLAAAVCAAGVPINRR